jgi:hypothetical protein
MPNLGIKYVGSAQLFDIIKHKLYYIKYVGFAQLFDMLALLNFLYNKYVGFAQLFI